MSDLTTMEIDGPPLHETRLRDYWALLKPRVMSLVVFTGFAGLWLAPGAAEIHPFIGLVAILSLALGAGAAGAINMWYDRDIDAIMTRTKNRPIPAGRVNADEALSFAIVTSLIAIITLGLSTNWVAAGLLTFANLYYSVFYTMGLKRRTPQNIVIGGAAGAFPPIIGWAAVTGSISWEPVAMFLIIFLWTPPHFWALSLFANADYQRAKIPMMPVAKGASATKRQMFVYTLVLLPVSVLPSFLGLAGSGYAFCATILSGFFIFTAWKVLKSTTHHACRVMFGYSVFYLFALFLALIIL